MVDKHDINRRERVIFDGNGSIGDACVDCGNPVKEGDLYSVPVHMVCAMRRPLATKRELKSVKAIKRRKVKPVNFDMGCTSCGERHSDSPRRDKGAGKLKGICIACEEKFASQ